MASIPTMATIIAARSSLDLSDNLLIVAYASNSVFQRFHAAATACGSRAGGGCILNQNDAPVCPAFELDGLFDCDIVPLLAPCNKLKLLPSSHTSSRLVDLLSLHKDIEPTKNFYFYVQENCYYFTLATHLLVAPEQVIPVTRTAFATAFTPRLLTEKNSNLKAPVVMYIKCLFSFPFECRSRRSCESKFGAVTLSENSFHSPKPRRKVLSVSLLQWYRGRSYDPFSQLVSTSAFLMLRYINCRNAN